MEEITADKDAAMTLEYSRRTFLAHLGLGAMAVVTLGPQRLGASVGTPTEHPDPRPDIDAAGVLPRQQVEAYGKEVADIYDLVREMPEIADGIGCSCGCSIMPGYRSLLTCYHEGGMAMGCAICQGTAKLVHGRWKEGQDLARIRRACDARFG